MVCRTYFESTPDGADPAGDAEKSDSLAFSLILFLATRSSREMAGAKMKVPSILKHIAEDAMRYFLVIFTSHFVLMMTLLLAPVSATVPLPACSVANDIQHVFL